MFILLLSGLSLAADSPKWTLQVDPLTTALGYVHLQVEYAFTDSISAYVGPHLRLFSGIGSEPEPYIGYGAEFGIRYYFEHNAPEGWWMLGRGVLAHVQDTESDESSLGGYGSILGGYTAILGNVFVLSGGLGIQRIDYGVGNYGKHTWFPAAHTALGVAF